MSLNNHVIFLYVKEKHTMNENVIFIFLDTNLVCGRDFANHDLFSRDAT